jgi:hypothetical protein
MSAACKFSWDGDKKSVRKRLESSLHMCRICDMKDPCRSVWNAVKQDAWSGALNQNPRFPTPEVSTFFQNPKVPIPPHPLYLILVLILSSHHSYSFIEVLFLPSSKTSAEIFEMGFAIFMGGEGRDKAQIRRTWIPCPRLRLFTSPSSCHPSLSYTGRS